jgi:hypothetical protein
MSKKQWFSTIGRFFPKSSLLFICCMAITPLYAQSDPLLEGTWTLESASVLKITGSDTTTVAIGPAEREELSIMLSDTVAFKADIIHLSALNDHGCCSEGAYVREGNRIEISFTAAPFAIEYRMEGATLHFRQQMLLGMVPPFTYQVLTAYKKRP